MNTSSSRIIKAAQYRTIIDAQKILLQAKEEARTIREQAQLAYEASKKKGFDEGFAEGKLEAGTKMLNWSLQTSSHLDEIEGKLVEVVNAAIRKIVGSIDSEDLVVRVVRNSLGLVSRQNTVTIRVNPRQESSVKKEIDRITGPFPRIKTITVMPDPDLEINSCAIDTRLGTVEASLSKQLDSINSALSALIKTRSRFTDGELRAIERETIAGIATQQKPA